MGFAIATVAAERGHRVTLVSGPVSEATPAGVEGVDVVTAAEMLNASTAVFDECDAAVMTAAVCDYRPADRLERKLHKQATARTVTLEPTVDICATLGQMKAHRVVVGFALEDHDHRPRAERKLARKQCDAIVLNEPGNIGSDEATIEVLIVGDGWRPAVSATKLELAGVVVQLVEELASRR